MLLSAVAAWPTEPSLPVRVVRDSSSWIGLLQLHFPRRNPRATKADPSRARRASFWPSGVPLGGRVGVEEGRTAFDQPFVGTDGKSADADLGEKVADFPRALARGLLDRGDALSGIDRVQRLDLSVGLGNDDVVSRARVQESLDQRRVQERRSEE